MCVCVYVYDAEDPANLLIAARARIRERLFRYLRDIFIILSRGDRTRLSIPRDNMRREKEETREKACARALARSRSRTPAEKEPRKSAVPVTIALKAAAREQTMKKLTERRQGRSLDQYIPYTRGSGPPRRSPVIGPSDCKAAVETGFCIYRPAEPLLAGNDGLED